jgi:antirestriction protein ArdC
MPTTNEIRQKITDQIVNVLKSGSLPPWRKPWRSDPNSGFPTNVVSGQRYRGVAGVRLNSRFHVKVLGCS